MYNYAAPIAIAKSSVELGEAMADDVAAEVVTLEAAVTPLVSAPAPALARITRQGSRGKDKSRDKGKDKVPIITE